MSWYVLIYNMEAFFMQEYMYIYFKRICEINSFIAWLKGDLKVALRSWLKLT